MDKAKYEKYKLTVKLWEHEFKKTNQRIPSKYDIKDAPMNVLQAYKMYYRMKTTFLSQTLTDILDEDEEDTFNLSAQMSQSSVSLNITPAINDLLDPEKHFPSFEELPKKPSNQEFEAAEHLTSNDDAWNEKMNKPKPKENKPATRTTFKKKMSLNIEPTLVKPLRNPKKSLSKSKLSNGSLNGNEENLLKDILPDLETILLEKSRSMKAPEIKKPATVTSADLKNSIDIGWLDRNTSSNSLDHLTKSSSSLTNTSSFGLSNLNIKSFGSTASLTCETLGAELKFHAVDGSDSEIVGNSDEEEEIQPKRPNLPVAKKRRLSIEAIKIPDPPKEIPKPEMINKVPEKPQRQSIRKKKTETDLEAIKEQSDGDFDGDDSDKDPTFSTGPPKDPVESNSPPPAMKRKKSVIKRSKEGIAKITKKATKLLKGKKAVKETSDEEIPEEKEEEINFLIDSDLHNMTTVPRASQKELKTTEKLFDNYLRQHEPVTTAASKIKVVVDAKTAAKKEALEKKIKTGTLNENYVRVNLRKKVFVRGKKAFSFSKYKKGVWRSKKAAALAGPEMDMRGCDGGVQRCYNCEGVGHFAQNCKKKGDSLLPIDVEVKDESPFPTLDEAAQMAADQKMLVHSSRIESIPQTSNEIWKELGETSDEGDNADKENKDRNSESSGVPSPAVEEPQKSYIGHKIPEEFLKQSGLLDMQSSSKDKTCPVYELNPDGSLPPAPKEVTEALKMFGHKNFRNGQEQAIMRVLCGVSTLVTLSTGSGKSLCYQLPAYLYRKKSHCITLVISPLVSLMEDQVHGIPEFVNAQCLHTNQTPKQREKTMEAIKAGKVEILLVSPEAVVSGEKSTGFGSLLRQLPPIAFACIDEAHCVSQWSHNFRPSYLMICRVLREKLGVKIVLGLTATATLQTRESIVRHLGIPDGLSGIISDIPLPDNLVLTISQDENRDRSLIAMLRGERFGPLQSIIIYCTRRDECERIAGYLRTCLQDEKKEPVEPTSKKRKRTKWSCEAYHAGLPASRRRTIQNAFMSSELRIVVATIAFGMGINKSDIRGVIHFNMPKSFESYVQEVGRAGRDGKPAHCHVFLDSKGNDLSELRRHIYSNSIDRHVIRKLLRKIFVPCSCAQHLKYSDDPEVQKELEGIDFSDEDTMEVDVVKPRKCKGHEVSFSIDQTVQLLDIPEENIATLLCYLELHEQRYIKVLGNAYTKCKIMSYSGAKFLKQTAKTCPPLAMAIALDLKKGTSETIEIASIEFDVVEVAAAIGWDSGIVKYQLKQLEWTTVNGASKRSPLTVTFSELGFRIRSPGDLSDNELDMALDSLEKRTSSQEKTQLIQLQIIFNTFAALAFKSFAPCSSSNFPLDTSDQLKTTIRSYFQSNLPMDVSFVEESSDTSDGEIASDIRQIISMYPDNTFTGRSLSRLFHGISSPCYPAVIWGRCKYWRAHMKVNFSRLVTLGNMELVKMRRVH